jgi:large subunit ribosomal protein L21
MAEIYAIFQTGGKQYRVKAGDTIKVEKLKAEDKVDFDQVLMVGDKIGNPLVSGAKVSAQVVAQERTDKILVFKKKRRHNYRRTKGHRQNVTVLKITEIKG